MFWNNLFFIKRCVEQTVELMPALCDRLDLWWMHFSDIFINNPHLQINKYAEFFSFFPFGLRVQPHMCVPIRAPSLTSCLQEIGYMELEHKLLPLHTRAFKLFIEFSNFCSSSNRVHANSLASLTPDFRFVLWNFLSLEAFSHSFKLCILRIDDSARGFTTASHATECSWTSSFFGGRLSFFL